jgi:hypothetical protein
MFEIKLVCVFFVINFLMRSIHFLLMITTQKANAPRDQGAFFLKLKTYYGFPKKQTINTALRLLIYIRRNTGQLC